MITNASRQLKLMLYQMKRVWGQPIRIYHPISNSVDLTTGVVSRDYTIIYVKRATVLPNTTKPNNFENPGLDDMFDRGGFFDRSERVVIVDAADLPSDYFPDTVDHIEYNGHRAQIKQFIELENKKGFAIKISEVTDAERFGVPQSTSNSLSLTQTLSGET